MPQRVRVLHVTKGLGLGGTEKTMQLFACGLDPRRFDAAAFSYADGPRRRLMQEAGLEVHVGPSLLKTLQRTKPHIVHIHRAGWPEPEMLRDIRLARVPVVVETNVFGRFDPTPLNHIVDKHLFVSEFCLRRYGLVHGQDITSAAHGVLYNPVDTDFFGSRTFTRDFNAPVLGRVSRADPGKWSPLALDIIPRLAQLVPVFKYRIIGGTDEARAFVRDRGFEKHVIWHDPFTTDRELADFHNLCSVHAHANSTGETFGMVIAEAMACGLPVVTHPCEGLKDNAQLELVDHGITGFVANTAEEYAEAVAWLFRNPDRARAMGQKGRDKARALYRTQTLMTKLERLYEELLAAKLGPTHDANTHKTGNIHAL